METQPENRITQEKKFWDSKAKGYDTVVNKFFPEIYEVILENVIKDASQSKKLLEAATGTGLLAIQLSGHVAHIIAIDISPEMLNVAKEKSAEKQINNIDFKFGDICNLPFGDKSFDTVIASNVLHLLFNPEMALKEIKRVLNDNGKVIIPTFCHGTNLKSQILSRILWLFGQKTRSRWSPKSFRKFVENNGFTITKEIYIDGKIPLLYLVALNDQSAGNA